MNPEIGLPLPPLSFFFLTTVSVSAHSQRLLTAELWFPLASAVFQARKFSLFLHSCVIPE